MMFLIGAIFILSSFTLMGWYQASQLSSRPTQIRFTIQALQRLETEIVYGLTPLPNALHSISRQIKEPIGALFARIASELEESVGSTAAEVWRSVTQQHWAHTSMRTAEKEIFLHLGTTMGISDRDDQIKHLRLAMKQLQAEEEAARDEARRLGQMWKSIGLLAGALIVILMY